MNKEQNRNQEQHKPIIQDDEVDLVQLVKTIWVDKKTIYYSVGICVLIGLIIAFTAPAKYSATATLLPSEENKGSSLGNLGSLAGMAGINLSSMMGDANGIPADLYPQIVGSYPFKKELIHLKYNFEDYKESLSIYDYVYRDTLPSFGKTLIKYTIHLPRTIKEAISSSKGGGDEIKEGYEIRVLNLSKDEQDALDYIEDVTDIQVDDNTGLVSVSVVLGESVLTAQFAQSVVNLLQKYIIDYKTEQVRQNLVFVQERCTEKKHEFEIAQKEFFEYKDSHRNPVSERVDPEYQRLSDAYDIAGSVYKGLLQQLEQAKIKVKEETPVFSVLEPVIIPNEKSAPNKKIILIVSLLLGSVIGVVLILGKIIIRKFE